MDIGAEAELQLENSSEALVRPIERLAICQARDVICLFQTPKYSSDNKTNLPSLKIRTLFDPPLRLMVPNSRENDKIIF
jgi:hypothetical protein